MANHLLKSLLIAALCCNTSPVWSKPLPMTQCLKLLESAKTRNQALEPLSEWVYSCQDEKARARCRALLLDWLKQERDPDKKAEVAELLGRFLAASTTPSADFEKCLPLLSDADQELAHKMWTEFGQQESLRAITPPLRQRLLDLAQSSRPGVRMEALAWAHQAALQQAPGEFQQEALKLMQSHLQDSDAEVRNEALYGCLALNEVDPKAIQALVQSRLHDPDPKNRSLILDFLEQHPVPQLAPELEKRLSELGTDSSQHFPSPNDELSPTGRAPEEPEPYRVVRTLFHLGPLSPAAWNYLETRALGKLNVNLLLPFVAGSGPEGNQLADLLFSKFPPDVMADVLTSWGERGLNPAQLETLQALIEKQNTGSNEGELRKTNLLGVLANSPAQPKSISLALEAVKDSHPGVRSAAIFALAKLDPKGPGGKAASQALQQFTRQQASTGMDYLIVASELLGLVPGWLAQEPLLHPQQPAPDPRWMHSMRDGSYQNLGTRLDLTRMQLRWLEAHPAQARKIINQIKTLSHSSDSRVAALAQASLNRLQP